MAKYDNYYLDLEKVSKLSDDEKKNIHDYYREMLMFSSDGRDEVATSFFHTLFNNGYLKEVRTEKIDKILS